MKKILILLLIISAPAFAVEKKTAPELIELARTHSPALQDAITATFSPKDLESGTAWAGHGQDLFFVTKASSTPSLLIDDDPAVPTQKLGDSGLYYATAQLKTSTLHAFHYSVAGARFGGSLDVPAFGPDSYLKPGVPSGTLSEKLTHTSKIYDGMKSEYWVYVPAQYDPTTPTALMVFQDGAGYINRSGNNPALNVIDNLIAQKKIPVMIAVFINPGDVTDNPGTPTYKFVSAYSEKWHRPLKDAMRSTEYDTVSDRYDHFLRDEILAEVESKYNVRKDAYSRAITGLSSGGICSFNAAWQMPDQFSRVITWIGSFTAIQWKEDPQNSDGGEVYPEKILRESHRNIRVWLQDGSNDQENDRYGSWPLANIRMANALHLKDYDFHFSFGKGTHNNGHGAAEFPEELTWLWRDYDPAKTEQTYAVDPSEKSKPPFRVTITNRDTQ